MNTYLRRKLDNRVFYDFTGQTVEQEPGRLISPMIAKGMGSDHFDVIEVDPPAEFFGKLMKYDGSWSVVDQDAIDSIKAADSAKQSAALADARLKRKEKITEVAKEKRDGSIVVSGVSVKTDNGHIAEMSGALEQWDSMGWTELDFTNSAGQAVTVNKAQLQGIYNAATSHRQAWRSWEAAKFRAVDDATTPAQVKEVDPTADWPGN